MVRTARRLDPTVHPTKPSRRVRADPPRSHADEMTLARRGRLRTGRATLGPAGTVDGGLIILWSQVRSLPGPLRKSLGAQGIIGGSACWTSGRRMLHPTSCVGGDVPLCHGRAAEGARDAGAIAGHMGLIVETGRDPVTGKRRHVSRIFRGTMRDAKKPERPCWWR